MTQWNSRLLLQIEATYINNILQKVNYAELNMKIRGRVNA